VSAGVRLREFALGQDPVAPTAGEDGFAALVPVDEPLSAGPPPVAPILVRRAEDLWAVRGVRCGSGHLVTSGLASHPRPRWSVGWTGLTLAQRELLWAFLVQDADGVCCGAQGGLRAMDIRIDGAGSSIVPVRPVGPVTEDHFTAAADGSYSVGEVLCEEVF
jgi:hypothetical protein